jgi:hypothetical protein
VAEGDGAADGVAADGVANGVTERLGRGVRDGLGDRVGLGADRVGLEADDAGPGVEAGEGSG